MRPIRGDQGALTLDNVGGGTRDARGRSRERGQVAVLFALLIPMLLGLAVIVLDIGNMYVHKRHNQTLVDAAAFAGATRFVGCSFQFGDPPAANAAIRETALQYAGDTFRSPGTYNLQVQKPDDVRVVLNSARFWGNGDPPDGDGLDDTLDLDGDPMTLGDPCSSKTLDVKATDDDVPFLVGLLPFEVDAKSKARVEIQQVVEQNGMLPWAVPEVDPAAVAAIFVDENTGNVVAAEPMTESDDVNLPFLEWATAADSQVDLQSESTGVIILVSKVRTLSSVPPLSLGIGGPTALTDMCTQDPGLVTCYGGDGQNDGLTFIHGWSDENGAPAAPVVRDTRVLNVTGPGANACTDDLSAPYFLRTGDCDLSLQVVLHFGSDPAFDPQTDAIVTFDAPGCPNGGCDMTWIGAGSSAGESVWLATDYATLDQDFVGRVTFDVTVQTEFPVGVTNTYPLPSVAYAYVANAADAQGPSSPVDGSAGPVEYLKLSTVDPVPDANSRNTDDPALASVIVTVGLQRPFQVESPLGTPQLLRVASPSGSQNQAFDCDQNVNFNGEIETGCETPYRENYGDWDGDGIKEWEDLLCTAYPNGIGLPPDPTDPVPNCVRIETGKKLGQFRQGLAARLKTPSCAPNNWPEQLSDFPDFFRQIDSTNDPRYVTLIVTDYGTFLGSGSSEAVPVKYFAGFYVTGWDKVGNAVECPDNEPHPWYPGPYRKSLDNGDVWGHFINVTIFSSSGKSNDELCNFDEIGTCIAVLVE